MDKKRILVIDDDEAFLDMIKINLESTGKFDVRTEARGSYCLPDVLIFKPDLILLDVIMDDIGGFDVAGNILEHGFTKEIPVIYVTGVIAGEKKNDINVVGNYPVLTKPVRMEVLIDAIERELSKK